MPRVSAGAGRGAPPTIAIAHDERALAPYRGGVVVPTMGALHEGHAELVRHAARLARERGLPALVTVFVNPTQFDQAADFARYPRTLEADAAICAGAGADCVFAPDAAVVYPPGGAAAAPPLPRVASEPGLEDAHRAGHFAGVCQVVARLFELTGARAAVFGEKDWQQLQVVRAMTREQRLGVEIIGRPTVRESDGLAMSSRNRFLSADQRRRAAAVSAALRAAQESAEPAAAERAMGATLADAGLRIDYAAVRHAETLLPTLSRKGEAPGRALIAVRVGSGADEIRLIDNSDWS